MGVGPISFDFLSVRKIHIKKTCQNYQIVEFWDSHTLTAKGIPTNFQVAILSVILLSHTVKSLWPHFFFFFKSKTIYICACVLSFGEVEAFFFKKINNKNGIFILQDFCRWIEQDLLSLLLGDLLFNFKKLMFLIRQVLFWKLWNHEIFHSFFGEINQFGWRLGIFLKEITWFYFNLEYSSGESIIPMMKFVLHFLGNYLPIFVRNLEVWFISLSDTEKDFRWIFPE